jgi:hypothetical protein
MTIQTIRTVDHQFDDGSESVLRVNTLTSERDGDTWILIEDEDHSEAPSVAIHSADQADRLIRAIAAAAAVIGWPEIETIELAARARRDKREEAEKLDAEGARVVMSSTEFSCKWIAENPVLAREKLSDLLRVPLLSVEVLARDKQRGLYDLGIWRGGEPKALVLPARDETGDTNDRLQKYLDTPRKAKFTFRRDKFVVHLSRDAEKG